MLVSTVSHQMHSKQPENLTQPRSVAQPPAVGAAWVVLTRGDRPRELSAAVRSIATAAPDDEVIVVGNGCDVGPIEGARTVALPENLGIPAGRNEGVLLAQAEIVCFLDDDARLHTADFGPRLRALFEADRSLGIVTFRITDIETGQSQRRHVPRIGNVDPQVSSAVTTFLGGACAIRAEVFEDVGLLPSRFFYALEETDFAWRALDAGWGVRYEGSLTVHHPETAPSRHPGYVWRTARNRVWLARRRLPAVLGVLYVGNWLVISLLRSPTLATLRQTISGTMEGLRSPSGRRRPMRWSTAVRMARLGRPPIV